MNLLTHRQPTRIMRQDASEHGIGGINLTSKFAWRWEIPEKLRLRATLNTLEYLAGYVGCWMEFHETAVAELEIFLCQGDSTSATGWIRKSNFDEEIQPLQLTIARALATLFIEHNTGLYSQWFRGDWNDVSDSCSRDHHLSEQELTELLLSTVPEQVPMDFVFVPLPQELVSKLTTWLLKLPKTKQSPKRPLRSKMATGAITSSTSMTSNSMMTRSSPSSTLTTTTNRWCLCRSISRWSIRTTKT